MDICEIPHFGSLQIYWDPEARAFGSPQPGAFLVFLNGRHQEGADGENTLAAVLDMLQKQFPGFEFPPHRSLEGWERAIKEEAAHLRWAPASVDGEGNFFYITPNPDSSPTFFDSWTEAVEALAQMGYEDGQEEDGRTVTVLAVPEQEVA